MSGQHPVWRALRPPARFGAALTIDSRRNRLILIGGEACAGPRGPEVWQMPLDSAWVATRIATQGLEPFPPGPTAAAYDSSADRVLAIGGAGSNEAWQLTLGPTPTWSALPVSGMSPPVRGSPAVAFDPAHNRFVVVGGAPPGGTPDLTDVWIVAIGETASWTLLQPQGGPPSTTAQAMLSYDPTHDRVLLYGGGSSVLWSLNLSGSPVWATVGTTGSGPPSWQGGVALFDASRQRLLVRGGADYTSPHDSTTWELRFAEPLQGEWLRLDETGPRPTLAWRPAAVDDPINKRWIVYGGYGTAGSNCQALGDIRALKLEGSATWEDLLPSISEPLEFLGIQALHDKRRGRIALVPGRAALGSELAGPLLWAPLAEPLRWTRSASAAQPHHRFEAIALLDSLGDRVLLFGGFPVQGEPDGTLWSYSLGGDLWEPLVTSGEGPAWRGAAAAALDPFHHRVLLFGGLVAGGSRYTESNELWSLDLSDPPVWNRILFSEGPGPRAGSTMVVDRNRRRALLFNGVSGNRSLREVWALDLDSLRWTSPSSGPQPSGLGENQIIEAPTEDALYAIGASRAFSVSRCDLSTLAWQDLQAVGGPPTAVSYRTTAIHDDEHKRIVVFDGSAATPEPWAVDLEAAGTLSVAHLDTRVDAFSRRATIWWRALDFAVVNATLERRVDLGSWDDLGLIQAYEGGLFTHVEPDLRPGASYEFRLRCRDGSSWTYTGVTTFMAPGPLPLAVQVFPNPALGELNVRYSLPGLASSTDQIEIFDVSGRRVIEQRLSQDGPSAGVVRIDQAAALRAGLYFVRLSSRSGIITSSPVVILR